MYAVKGITDGPAGYVHPAMKAILKELDKHNKNGNNLTHNVKIMTVLTMRDPETLQAK